MFVVMNFLFFVEIDSWLYLAIPTTDAIIIIRIKNNTKDVIRVAVNIS